MNKKKILTLALTLSMVAILAIGGTIAYFTDTDSDTNVMTTGYLEIVQNETDRNGDPYTDKQKLVPAVYFDEENKQYNPTYAWEGPEGGKTGGFESTDGESEMELYTDSLENEIDKIVSVTNKSNTDAYVRTIVLLEDNDSVSDNLHIVYSDTDVCARETIDQVKVDNDYYEAWIFTYVDKVEAGETSKPSLKQVWLDPNTPSDWYKKLGDDQNMTIVALSQATQVEGFEDLGAGAALDAAFGDVTAENIAKWVAETGVKTTGDANKVGGI